LNSPHSKRAYGRAIYSFLGWWQDGGKPPLVKAIVQKYLTHLQEKGLSPATVNLHISAIRKLAAEAADNGLIPQDIANVIGKVKGVRFAGVRVGNWLTKDQAQILINTPDTTKIKGLRDRAILAVLVGTGLRRAEVANLEFQHIQQREGRWVIVDLVGKGNRVRTVPIPSWVKVAIDEWAKAADIRTGRVFRGVYHYGNKLLPDSEGITPQAIYYAVQEAIYQIGFLEISPHDLRRTFAKLAHKGGSGLDQIQLSLGHASIQTTERYLGIEQDLHEAPCDRLGLGLED
jgi:site-specific recombinase XerD